MFFFKKFISAFLMPVPIGIFLLLLALVFLLKNSNKKAKLFLIFGFLWFTLLSFQPISNAIIKPLEDSHKALLISPNVEYILVLGNAHFTNENLSITSQVHHTAINRLVEGIRHYRNLKNAKIIVSGNKFYDKNSHAHMQEKLALSLGVKKEDIIKLHKPKDTLEEALEVKRIVKEKAFILVTSASHMKRAMMIFQKQGLHPLAAPTQNLAKNSKNFISQFSSYNLLKVTLAFHEYLGIFWGKIKGFL